MNRSQAIVIAVVLAATGLTGVLTYQRLRTPFPKTPPGPAPAGPIAPRSPLLEEATKVATTFAGHLGKGQLAEAYALLAEPYRKAVSPEAFGRSCQASPILSGARAVSLHQLRQQSVGGSATIEASGALESAAGAVPTTFVFLRETAGLRVLVVNIAGVPVLQGVVPAP